MITRHSQYRHENQRRPARFRSSDVARSGATARKSACATSRRRRRGAIPKSTVRSKVYFRNSRRLDDGSRFSSVRSLPRHSDISLLLMTQ